MLHANCRRWAKGIFVLWGREEGLSGDINDADLHYIFPPGEWFSLPPSLLDINGDGFSDVIDSTVDTDSMLDQSLFVQYGGDSLPPQIELLDGAAIATLPDTTFVVGGYTFGKVYGERYLLGDADFNGFPEIVLYTSSYENAVTTDISRGALIALSEFLEPGESQYSDRFKFAIVGDYTLDTDADTDMDLTRRINGLVPCGDVNSDEIEDICFYNCVETNCILSFIDGQESWLPLVMASTATEYLSDEILKNQLVFVSDIDGDSIPEALLGVSEGESILLSSGNSITIPLPLFSDYCQGFQGILWPISLM